MLQLLPLQHVFSNVSDLAREIDRLRDLVNPLQLSISAATVASTASSPDVAQLARGTDRLTDLVNQFQLSTNAAPHVGTYSRLKVSKVAP